MAPTSSAPLPGTVLHLRNGATSVVVDLGTPGLPGIIHWGEDLGILSERELADLALATAPQRVSGGLDIPSRITLLPQDSAGWQGTPGLSGSRGGRAFSPRFSIDSVACTDSMLTLSAIDRDAGLSLVIELTVDAAGLLTQQLTLTNTGTDRYEVVSLAATFPVPVTAREILDTSGRHLRERSPQRHGLTVGRHERESRTGRPGANATLLLCAGTVGFGFERGLVHAVHLAWSGNHRLAAERLVSSAAIIQASELLLPGEIILEPGASYQTPPAVGSWGDGLTALSARFHGSLRARPHHPSTPRPVTLNTWEAVYFTQDLAKLRSLADRAAEVGVERYVLDDGWFRGRRDDTSGLGDWFVDADVWPDGLAPLSDHVVSLGMQFGLWVEPEMVNLDSDLARAHPDWILQASGRLPVEGRHQQVLDLANPEVFDYLLGRLDALLTEYPISYLKWDHNRDLADAGSTRDGAPAVHTGVLALYRLLDLLKLRHPGLEIESCASGGARVDLGILQHTDRIWASDCIDPLERLTIHKYTSLLVPYELLGAHIGSPDSHSTRRHHDLTMRAGVALFGHFGIEWDITSITPEEVADLAHWVALYRANRELIHTGRAVFADLADETMDLRGVVAADGSRALFINTQLASSESYPPGALHFPGLDDDRRYSVRRTAPASPTREPGQSPLLWATRPVVLSGRALRTVGIQAPVQYPGHLSLIELTAL